MKFIICEFDFASREFKFVSREIHANFNIFEFSTTIEILKDEHTKLIKLCENKRFQHLSRLDQKELDINSEEMKNKTAGSC